jgi:hypothetical protein
VSPSPSAVTLTPCHPQCARAQFQYQCHCQCRCECAEAECRCSLHYAPPTKTNDKRPTYMYAAVHKKKTRPKSAGLTPPHVTWQIALAHCPCWQTALGFGLYTTVSVVEFGFLPMATSGGLVIGIGTSARLFLQDPPWRMENPLCAARPPPNPLAICCSWGSASSYTTLVSLQLAVRRHLPSCIACPIQPFAILKLT